MAADDDARVWRRLGRLVWAARDELGYTQKELAQLVGCSNSRISRLESHGEPIRAGTLRVLFGAIQPGLARRGSLDTFQALCMEIGYLVGPEPVSLGSVGEAQGEHGAAAGASEGAVGAPGEAPGSGWRRWWELAQGHQQREEFERAIQDYEQAATYARTPGQQALALAQQAACWQSLNDLGREQHCIADALRLLGLAQLPPEQATPIQIIESQLKGDEQGMQAYATVTEVRGLTLLHLEDFETARRAFGTLRGLAQALGDPAREAQALHFHGRVLVEQATVPPRDDFGWRTLTHRGRLDQALRSFRQAQALHRQAGDWTNQAHDLRHLANALQLRGDDRNLVARTARESQELFGPSRSAANLHLFRGRWASDQEAATPATDAFLACVRLALEMRSRSLLSWGLVGLAELQCAQGTRADRRQALGYWLVALLAWPYATSSRDFRRIAQLFGDLFGEETDMAAPAADDLWRFCERAQPPLDVFWQGEAWVAARMRELAALLKAGG